MFHIYKVEKAKNYINIKVVYRGIPFLSPIYLVFLPHPTQENSGVFFFGGGRIFLECLCIQNNAYYVTVLYFIYLFPFSIFLHENVENFLFFFFIAE